MLLPGLHLPLHIFEPRYRQLTTELITGVLPDRQFGVIAIRNSLVTDVTGIDQLHQIGCTARLREARSLPDGRFDIVTTGSRRFRVLDIDAENAPYLTGTVEWLPDDPLRPGSAEATITLGVVARAAHQRYCEAAWEHGDWHAVDADADPASLAYLLAADCLLPLADRQALLAETNPVRRLRMVCHLLAREAGFLSALRAVPASHTQLSELGTPANLN